MFHTLEDRLADLFLSWRLPEQMGRQENLSFVLRSCDFDTSGRSETSERLEIESSQNVLPPLGRPGRRNEATAPRHSGCVAWWGARRVCQRSAHRQSVTRFAGTWVPCTESRT
jgi:hypothetical protein